MNDTEHLNNAIAAHGRWKARLRQAIEAGKSDWKADSVRPDNLCEFGKWLIDTSGTDPRTLPRHAPLTSFQPKANAK